MIVDNQLKSPIIKSFLNISFIIYFTFIRKLNLDESGTIKYDVFESFMRRFVHWLPGGTIEMPDLDMKEKADRSGLETMIP